MSIKAGSIVTIAGRNVVDRLQSAGLGNSQIPITTIYETGNDLAVDKVPGEPDFTFSMTSWDVTTDMMAFLTGAVGDVAANLPPGNADAAGTEYRWENVVPVNITSPWKRDTGSQGGHIKAGLIIPGYSPTRLRYNFGVTDMASQEVELAGGAFYYAETAPVEEYASADGTAVAFATAESARALRIGGAGGTDFTRVFGVLVNNVIQVRGVDYVESIVAADTGQSAITTITFPVAPVVSTKIRFCYFTETAKTVPQALNADTTIKPGAVRGRDIIVRLDPDGDDLRFGGVQTLELEATVAGETERELGNPDPTGRSNTGIDTTGTVTTRPKDIDAFFTALSQVTGIAKTEVFGYFNNNTIPVLIDIRNPKDPSEILKSIFIEDGQFQPPGTPARVNAPTDFAFPFSSVKGTFSEFKGGRS